MRRYSKGMLSIILLFAVEYQQILDIFRMVIVTRFISPSLVLTSFVFKFFQVHDDMETSHYMKNFDVGHVPLRLQVRGHS